MERMREPPTRAGLGATAGFGATAGLGATAVLALLTSCGSSAVEVQEATDPGAAADAALLDADPGTEPERIESRDGLVVRLIERGSGPRASVGDRLRLHYRGTVAASGDAFRSTLERGIPDEVVLGHNPIIPGLERALLGMRAGTRAEVQVPAQLAYGSAGLGAIPPDADLRFELRLLSIR